VFALQTPPQPPQEPDALAADEVTLEALLDELLSDSQELKAAGTRVLAANARPDRAESLPDPSLSLVYRNVGFPELTLGEEMMTQLGLRFTQTLPGRGKRTQRRALAEMDVGVAEAQVASIRRRLVQEVTTAFYELDYICASIDIVHETRELLLDLEETAETRYAVGDGLQQDVFKGQVEISVLLNRLVQLDQQRASLEALINRKVGRRPGMPLGRPAHAGLELDDLPIAELVPEATRSSAALAARSQRIQQQQAAVAVLRTDRRPDVMLSGAYMNRGGLPGIWEVNVGFTLPVRKEGRQDLEIEEGEQELDARRIDHVDAVQAIELVVHDSYLRADRAVRLTRLYSDAILPQAVLSLESAIAGYGVGTIDFPALLDNVVTLLTYRLELKREETNYATAVVRIEEHLGRSLGATPDGVWR
jgi:outer membrane protein TolC